MRFEIVYGMFNALKAIFKREKEANEKAEKETMEGSNIPSISSIQSQANSMMSNVKVPKL